MLIRFLHWVAKDVLPDKVWVRWLRWRYQRENRPTKAEQDAAFVAEFRRLFTAPQHNIFDPPSSDAVEHARAKRLEHQGYNRGGVIRVDRHLIPHSPWAKDCMCASCHDRPRQNSVRSNPSITYRQ